MIPSHIVKKQLDKIGVQIYLKDSEWTSMPFYACVNYLWRKKSTAFEPDESEIGTQQSEYYLYIGPSNHDILSLSDDAIVCFDDMKLEFKRRDAVKIKNEVAYYTGILRKIKEGEYEEY